MQRAQPRPLDVLVGTCGWRSTCDNAERQAARHVTISTTAVARKEDCTDDPSRTAATAGVESTACPMRLPGPMTADEFAESLALASRGQVRTDDGGDDAVTDALEAVAGAAPDPPPELIAAAELAYSRLVHCQR